MSNYKYIGKKSVAFTGNVKYRKSLFDQKFAFIEIEKILLHSLASKDCEAHIYLFMPDHFHFILTGRNVISNIKKCIDSFKQKSGFWLSQNMPEYKWQKDYFDHVIRGETELANQIRYILMNPVKAGLVDHWKQYKYKGSTIYDLDEWD